MLTPYYCPFRKGDRVIELGGGPGRIGTETPLFRPNVDGRPGPMVDIVHNLEDLPWPLESNAYDGVYSAFFLEHVSHRRVREVIAEIHRILAPGGIAVVLTADTFAQCRMIVDAGAENLDDRLVNMLFGGGDYPENFHRCGFSRPQVERLFRQAGFWEVHVLNHPGLMGPNGYEEVTTDMIVEGYKSNAQITYTN
jgi:SAM-dependent methyltransferase